MNEELSRIIKLYTAHGSGRLLTHLHDLSKYTLSSLLIDLLTMYINDQNSSTLREFITVVLAGYEHTEHKIGYNGFRHSAFGEPIMCEAKPVNIISSSRSRKKLNGGGNFTDFTWGRFNKYKNDKINMLVSGFVDGKLIYIFEFPFSCEQFMKHLSELLERKFPDGDVSNSYLRSASFSLKHYLECKDLHIAFALPENELEDYRNFMTRSLYNFLKNGATHEIQE